ncbi:uncharacterized protein LOC143286840 [Babylonia areolata]|uniref:uncharacterized protein LOC143286840 n=1 Tax=Babylonia areolata TaxID=304850 RepID=UPI003FD55B96
MPQHNFDLLELPLVHQPSAGIRCKRKLMEEDRHAISYKKNKIDDPPAEPHYWTAVNRLCHQAQQDEDANHHSSHLGQRVERSMDTGLETEHNSLPVSGYQPPKPSTPPAHMMHRMPSQKDSEESRMSSMMVVDDMPDSNRIDCNRTSDPFGLDNRIEYCSSECRGAPRSPVSNRITCSCDGPYDRPDPGHYVSDIY